MKRTLPWAAVALACLLPTTSFAEPPSSGETFDFNGGPGIFCREQDDMIEIAVTPEGPEWQAVMVAKVTSGVCIYMASTFGSAVIGQSVYAGPDNGIDYWAVEVTPEGVDATLWYLWQEPVGPEPSGWRI